jgi:hypothetical protein
MNKYEQLIEHIINDEEDKARALFHEIVVEKSRDIYESLMDEEYADDGVGGSPVESMMHEIDADQNGGIGEDSEMDGEMDGDMSNMSDMVAGMGDEGEEDLEQKVMDLESELEALKAEFEQLMGDEEGDDGEADMGVMDGEKEEEEGDEEGEEEFAMMEEELEEEEVSESVYESSQRRPLQKTAVDLMREYVETVAAPANAEGHEVGKGGSVNVNKTSITDNMKNDMGGTANNLNQGGKGADAHPDGTSPKGKADGKLVKNVQEIDVATRNVNKVGGNKGAQDFYKTKASAKKGEGQTTDGSVPTNKRSIEPGGN